MPAASKSSSAREPDSRQRELVEATYAQIAEVGLEGLRTRDVAARVGINIATLHYYFPTKQALVLGVVRHVNEMFQTLRAPLVEGTSIIDQIIRTARQRDIVAPELHIVLLELGIRSARDQVIADAMSQNQIEWRSWLEHELRVEIGRGIVRPDIDARAVAALLSSLVIGASMQLRMNPDAFEFEPVFRHLESLLKPSGVAAPARKRVTKKRT